MSAKIGPKEEQLRQLKRHHRMMVDDGAPIECLRSADDPPERKVEATARIFAAAEAAAHPRLMPEEQAIREEAGRRWRGWTISPAERSRPRLATFVKRVRDERKKAAKAAKTKMAHDAAAKPTAKHEETDMAKKIKRTAKRSAKKATAKRPAAKAAPERKAPTIGEIARKAILDGKTNEQALALVKKAHPEGNTNVGNISWYRSDLRKNGLLADGPVPTEAARS